MGLRGCGHQWELLLLRDQFLRHTHLLKGLPPSAQHHLSKASGYARRMAGEAPALKPKLTDNVALNQRPSMAARPTIRPFTKIQYTPALAARLESMSAGSRFKLRRVSIRFELILEPRRYLTYRLHK